MITTKGFTPPDAASGPLYLLFCNIPFIHITIHLVRQTS